MHVILQAALAACYQHTAEMTGSARSCQSCSPSVCTPAELQPVHSCPSDMQCAVVAGPAVVRCRQHTAGTRHNTGSRAKQRADISEYTMMWVCKQVGAGRHPWYLQFTLVGYLGQAVSGQILGPANVQKCKPGALRRHTQRNCLLTRATTASNRSSQLKNASMRHCREGLAAVLVPLLTSSYSLSLRKQQVSKLIAFLNVFLAWIGLEQQAVPHLRTSTLVAHVS